jgi:serine/threonine protein kinase
MQRDLKPDNILMYPAHDTMNGYRGMQAKLTDFDCSKDYGSGSELQTQIGTLPFEAPEILFDGVKDVTNAVDVWGVGKLH